MPPTVSKAVLITGCSSGIGRATAEHLASSARLVTDGLSCWTAAAEAGLEHRAMATGSGRRAAGWSPFRWVNTTLGNVKAAITGTYLPPHQP